MALTSAVRSAQRPAYAAFSTCLVSLVSFDDIVYVGALKVLTPFIQETCADAKLGRQYALRCDRAVTYLGVWRIRQLSRRKGLLLELFKVDRSHDSPLERT